ncbi:MAG: hypothetical protein R3B09_23825 [Nannocystaceae bacterium]
MKHVMQRALALVLCLGSSSLVGGCTSLDEIYYIATEDPESGIALYYRVQVQGRASGGKTKYSVGFYDRAAVERLFAENTIEREYLSTKLDLFDPQTGARLTDLSRELERAKTASEAMRRGVAVDAHASVAALLGTYETKLRSRPSLEAEYTAPMKQARASWKQAGQALGLTGDANGGAKDDAEMQAKKVSAAISDLREAQSILETIRVAIDGRVLVRHFDGAGNEIDTDQKTLVIFVANDVSRFAEAIRQLAESQETTKDVINIVLGRKAAEVARLREQVNRSGQDNAAMSVYMNDVLKALPEKPGQEELKKALSSVAQVVSGKVGEFKSAAEIRAFAEGME